MVTRETTVNLTPFHTAAGNALEFKTFADIGQIFAK